MGGRSPRGSPGFPPRGRSGRPRLRRGLGCDGGCEVGWGAPLVPAGMGVEIKIGVGEVAGVSHAVPAEAKSWESRCLTGPAALRSTASGSLIPSKLIYLGNLDGRIRLHGGPTYGASTGHGRRPSCIGLGGACFLAAACEIGMTDLRTSKPERQRRRAVAGTVAAMSGITS